MPPQAEFSAAQRRRFRARLLQWYDRNRRDLPWRRTADPYAIWVSEIMLQQTRVPVAAAYFLNFMKLFPSVAILAAAGQSSVLGAWSGLGYYRRARMLHLAARHVVKEFGGELPRHAAELRQLNGIGRYTAAAIASIAFQQPEAAVDGNIERVLSRILQPSAPPRGRSTRVQTTPPPAGQQTRRALGAKRTGFTPAPGERTWRAATELLSPRRPGDFNQAMMELGATVCLPRQPLCDRCPVYHWCAVRAGSSARAGSPIRRSPAKRSRKVAYALATRDAKVLLTLRPSRARQMPAMWELPQIEKPAQRRLPPPLLTLNHAITNTIYRVSIHAVDASTFAAKPATPQRWLRFAKLNTLPLTGLCRKVLLVWLEKCS